MPYSIPNTIANGDTPDATILMGNFDYIENSLNDYDGSHVTAGTIADAALVNSPADIRQETIIDQVITGLTSADPGASLTGVVAAGTAYIEGIRVVVNSFTNAYTASKDCYVDLDKNGTFHVTEVANGAAAPALYTNSTRICMFVTNGSEITSYTDMRTMFISSEAYVPTLAGITLGNGTMVAYYSQQGKDIFVNILFTLGSTSNFTGTLQFGIPKKSGLAIGLAPCWAVDQGTGYHLGTGVINPSTSIITGIYVGGGASTVWNATVPFTWTNGDVLMISAQYKTA